MKKGKYAGQNRSFGSKSLALVLALVLLTGGAVGGTLAWLTANSTPVENTFTTSNIGVSLTEKETEFKMVPGHSIDKDPRVTVTANSEDCYLFIEVTESNIKDYIKYAVNTETPTKTDTEKVDDKERTYTIGGWTQGEGTDGVPTNVYYRKVMTNKNENQVFAVLGGGTYPFDNGTPDIPTDDMTFTWTDDQVLTLPTVKMENMTAADSNKPLLSFTAYAVQLYKTNNEEFLPGEAWTHAVPAASTP